MIAQYVNYELCEQFEVPKVKSVALKVNLSALSVNYVSTH